METISIAELGERVGQEIGVSAWIEIAQPLIDQFAELTDDRQFIHVDPARAQAEGPFGGTVAHGFLTMSLLSAMSKSALPEILGISSSINYGFDRLRFVDPVPAGSRVRARFRLERFEPRGTDRVLTAWEVSVEIEGSDRPALIADWLSLRFLAAPL